MGRWNLAAGRGARWHMDANARRRDALVPVALTPGLGQLEGKGGSITPQNLGISYGDFAVTCLDCAALFQLTQRF